MRILAFLFLLISAVTASAQTAPAPPTNLTATAISNKQIRLNWTPPSSVPLPSGHHVYRALAAGGTPVQITAFGELSGTSATFTDDDPALVSGVAYKYTVRAFTGTEEAQNLSELSNEVTATPVATPSSPLNLRSTGRTSSTISLAWGAVTGAVSYTIVRDGDEIETVTTTTFTDEDLELSTPYTYVVFATTATGEDSADSNEITVTTFGDGSDKQAAFAKRFRQIDVNADGALSLDEYVQGHGGRLAWVVVKHRFDYSDTDGSESLSLAEYAKALGGRKFMAPNKSRQFLLADIDADGELQGDEYPLILPSQTKPAKVAKMFTKKDKDDTLGLSPAELGIRVIYNPDPEAP